MDLTLRRRFFAEEVEAVANLRTTALVEALAAVPREAFLPAGPWTVVGEGGLGAARLTADADPARVYHCLAVAIDALALRPGEHVVHVGCGLGYYTALLAHCVGPGGRVTAIEIEASLAAGAARNLAGWPWGGWSVRLLTLVAIYSAVGLRDETLAAQVAAALTGNPLPPLQRLRRDRHAPSPSCWLHGPTSCLSLEAAGPS